MLASAFASSSEGRTTTTVDDWLTRAIGPLPRSAALLLAGVVYAGVGLALPLLLRWPTVMLIAWNVIGVMIGLVIALAWLFPVVEARLRRQLLEHTTNVRSLSAIEFEMLVGELLRREGWHVEEVARPGEPDGNIDLRARRRGQRRIVQCKRWDSRLVGVDEVRKLAGTLMREGLAGGDGLFVTCSEFAPAAKREAKQIGIELVDSSELLRRLEHAGADALLVHADAVRRAYLCPKCGTPMVLGHSLHGWWIHCPDYPNGCKGKRDLGADPRRALELLLLSS